MPDVRIDRRLHLVVPIYGDGDKIVAHAHSTPLSEESIDRWHKVLALTFNEITTGGYGFVAGPRHAMRILRDLGQRDDLATSVREATDEIRRLTNVLAPAGEGQPWQPVPLQVAVDRKFITEEDRREVENAVVFFIVSCATFPRHMLRGMVEESAKIWGAQITSSSATGFLDSLRTSTATASSGEKSPAPAPADSATANAMVDGRPASLPH